MRSASLLLVLSALPSACDSIDTIHAGQLVLTAGAEESPWDISPRATSAELFTIRADGKRVDGPKVNVPLAALRANSETVSAYGFDGTDDTGQRVIGARSLLIDALALAESSLPLFYGRTRTFTRPPGEFSRLPGAFPVHSILKGRYWITVVPNELGNMTVLGYDLLAWRLDVDELEIRCPSSHCVPTAVACSDSIMVVLGESWGIWVDLDEGTSGDLPLPDGLESYAELAGARTINSPDDRAFIVGPTRGEDGTDVVLELSPKGTLELLRTRGTRANAAATWAEGVGLVLAGGSEAAPGIELLAADDDHFVELAFPPFAAQASQITFDAPRLLSFGGHLQDGSPAPLATFDLDCIGECSPEVLPLQLEIGSGVAAKSETDTYTVIGSRGNGDAVGAVVNLATLSSDAVESSRRRANAGYALLPTGHLGVIGGEASDDAVGLRIELVLP